MDSSSAILLFKAGMIEQALACYIIVVPESVEKELTRPGREGAEFFLMICSQGRMVTGNATEEADENAGLSPEKLGPGERDVLSLYAQGKGDFIVVDDKKAAQVCIKKKIPYVNALLLVRIFADSGRITRESYSAAFEKLTRIGWYSERIVSFARSCERERISDFFP